MKEGLTLSLIFLYTYLTNLERQYLRDGLDLKATSKIHLTCPLSRVFYIFSIAGKSKNLYSMNLLNANQTLDQNLIKVKMFLLKRNHNTL